MSKSCLRNTWMLPFILEDMNVVTALDSSSTIVKSHCYAAYPIYVNDHWKDLYKKIISLWSCPFQMFKGFFHFLTPPSPYRVQNNNKTLKRAELFFRRIVVILKGQPICTYWIEQRVGLSNPIKRKKLQRPTK